MKKKITTLILLASAVWVGLFQSGCAPAEPRWAAEPIITPTSFSVETIGYSFENRPIDLYSAGNGPETIFIYGAIHGNEQAGIPLCYWLMDRIRKQSDLLEGRKILIVPVANPDGVVRNIRGNANKIDLNRNFPAANRENSDVYGHSALSEPESRILYDLINRNRPTRIVSIHQPLKCIDYDGPAEGLAHQMALYCPLPVRKLGARPGSFGAWAGEKLQIPIITLELERADDKLTDSELWQKYGASLLAAITYPQPPF